MCFGPAIAIMRQKMSVAVEKVLSASGFQSLDSKE
jgi:hypothetical protein